MHKNARRRAAASDKAEVQRRRRGFQRQRLPQPLQFRPIFRDLPKMMETPFIIEMNGAKDRGADQRRGSPFILPGECSSDGRNANPKR